MLYICHMGIWIDKYSKDALVRFNREFMDGMVFGFPPDERSDEQRYIDDCKLAYVILQGDDPEVEVHTVAFVHRVDGKAYRIEGMYSIVRPLKELKIKRFERWLRLMDI